MNLSVIQPPPFEPVTLAEVRAHLRLDAEGSPAAHPDDAMLQRHITAARQHVESMARRSLVQQVRRLSLAGFPGTIDISRISDEKRRLYAAPDRLLLHRPPVLRVEAVRYYDGENVLQVLDPALYYVTDEQVPELRFTSSFGGATVYDRPDAVRIDYVAGYAPAGSPATLQADYAAAVPQPLKEAVLLTVQLLYDSLTDQERQSIERLREALVQPLRVQLSL